MSQVPRFTFSKEEKLCSLKIIESLFTSGKMLKNFPIRLVWKFQPLPYPVPSQVVFVVSKKSFSHAVDRNKIRRQMREIFRRHKHPFNEACSVKNRQIALMLIYSGKKQLPYPDIENKIILILQRLTETLQGDVQ